MYQDFEKEEEDTLRYFLSKRKTEIIRMIKDPQSGFKIKNRKYGHPFPKEYPRCFIGNEAGLF